MKRKNILLSLLFLSMGLSIGNAQDTLLIEPTKIDSLQELINARGKEDEEKVKLLNEYARLCFYSQEFAKGFVATREARQISKNLGFTGGEIMFYHTLAAFHGWGEMYNYRLQQAKSIAQKAESQVSDYPEPIIPAGWPPNLGQPSLDKLRPVLDFFNEVEDKEIQLTLIDPITWCYYTLGRTEDLKIILKKAAEVSRDLNQLYPEFLAMSRLKVILDREGEVEESKKLEQELIDLLSKAGNDNESAYLKFIQANYYNNSGQYALAIDYYLQSAKAFEDNGNLNMLVNIYTQVGYAYETLEMQEKALEIYEKYLSIFKALNDNIGLQSAYHRPVLPLYELKRYEEARKYMALAIQGSNEQSKPLLLAKSNMLEGQILMDSGKYRAAIPYLQKAYESYQNSNDNQRTAEYTISFTLLYMAECYLKLGNIDSALKYALECLQRENALNHNRKIIKVKISFLIAEIYVEQGQAEKALDYIKMYQEIVAESNKTENANKIAEAEIRSIIDKSEKQIELLEKERLQKIQESKNQRLWIFSIAGALLSALFVAFILFRNNKNKQKANVKLKEQKEEVESTLEKLESTQSQLIQSEKMASLGELTAGIAHEIQNPLNFVNNFSEVNSELIDELEQEIDDRNLGEAKEITKDLRENENKIKHHGQRASSIVKGMLEHSRTGDGVKEPTDINALADEYLRLAYHGLRAKDNSFNADFKTEFDESLLKIKVVPQDIGRVLLNLINNAFYAVHEKAARHSNPERSDEEESYDYKPEVTVSTKLCPLPDRQAGSPRGIKGEDKIEISVKDNGPGIPEQVRDKIFQPFFTTKPSGSGTGLGLSLSYDIVKAHGGELKVESQSGEKAGEVAAGTEFIIQLPLIYNQ